MKILSVSRILVLALLMPILFSCKKETPDEPLLKDGEGLVSFYLCEDMKNEGKVTIQINGNSYQLISYLINCADPGCYAASNEAIWRVILPAGVYPVNAGTESGIFFSDTITLEAGRCFPYRFIK